MASAVSVLSVLSILSVYSVDISTHIYCVSTNPLHYTHHSGRPTTNGFIISRTEQLVASRGIFHLSFAIRSPASLERTSAPEEVNFPLIPPLFSPFVRLGRSHGPCPQPKKNVPMPDSRSNHSFTGNEIYLGSLTVRIWIG